MGRIYVYRAPGYNVDWERTTGSQTIFGHGRLKVGFTSRDSRKRVEEQLKTAYPHGGWELLADEEAVRQDGTSFRDTEIHHVLDSAGVQRNSEVVEGYLEEVLAAIAAVRARRPFDPGRTADFPMRPEQQEAVEVTSAYFTDHAEDKRAPRFLWNAKMRFGKTFTTYQLAKKMGWKRILVLTYKPAVRNSWRDDLNSHVDFTGWEFVDRDNPCQDPDTTSPLVWFASFQDLLGTDEGKSVKEHNESIHLIDWDCIVLDEYHYGAWQGAAKELSSPATTVASEKSQEKAEEAAVAAREAAADDADRGSPRLLSVVPEVGKVDGKEVKTDVSAEDLSLSSKQYLYLSGTPFRALTEGEFNEDAIFSWTYPQEQNAKREWTREHPDEVPNANPYFDLPEMQMFTYALPRVVDPKQESRLTEEFDLSRFFEAKKIGSEYHFTNPDQVVEFLDMLHGKLKPALVDKLDKGNRPPFPYSDARFTQSAWHSVWLMPSVASAHAIKGALDTHPYFRDYLIHVAAGGTTTGVKAKEPVDRMLDRGERDNRRTITLSVGKLMTGVTVPQWGAILILRSLKSPEAYFQSAFRVQSPWTMKTETGERVPKKDKCYVFDFDPQRALSLIYQYGTKLAGEATKSNPSEVIAEMIDTLPIFAFDGSRMDPVDVNEVMDWATAGAGAAMLAKRWGSQTLIDLSETVLTKLLADDELLERLGQIEDFRNLRRDASKILASSQKVREGKKRVAEAREAEDPELVEERKRKRDQVMTLRKKLLKFVQTIPVFMYLTDHREEALVDVIESLDTTLFERVTGLTIDDFHRLSDVGVFHPEHMNEAIWQFRLFERASLDYLQLRDAEYEDAVTTTGLWATTTREPLVAEQN